MVVCWYIRSVLGYVILAALVTVLTNPLCNLICKMKIKGHYCPRWLGTILSMLAVFLIMVGALTFMVPLISSIAKDISKASVSNIAQTVSVPLAQLNSWIVRTIPKVGADFKIENFVVMQLQDLLVTSDVGVVVGSVTKTVAKLGTGIFAVLFISFFFIISLIAAQIGGMAGMFAAIPAYTVLRVMAKQFLGDVKVVKALTSINP